MKKIIFCLTVLATVCSSCIDTVDADQLLKGSKEYIMINSFISPANDTLSVEVSKAVPSIGRTVTRYYFSDMPSTSSNNRESFVLKDAKVFLINEGNQKVELLYTAENFSYQIPATQFAIESGKTYRLLVELGTKKYTASCTIPENRITTVSANFQRKINDGFNDPFLTLEFQDFINEENYYVVGASRSLNVDGQTYKLNFYTESLVNDRLLDGALLKAVAYYNGSAGDTITLQVANVEKIIYDVLFAEKTNEYNDGNPFGELSIPPSNIEGEDVLGVFAGYQYTTKDIIGVDSDSL